VLDARRGEIYGAVYGADLGLVFDEVVMPFEKWIASLAELPTHDLELVAGGFEPPRQPYPVPHPVILAPRAIAGAVARIAARKLQLGEGQDPAALDANYVRRSDAELLWRDPLAR
jgi:tRNA threonylcarbamoyladenosine biosynthesis protein TsaB